MRLQLELLKPEMILDEAGVDSTIVMFGGARIPAPEYKDRRGRRSLPRCRLLRGGAAVCPAGDGRGRWPRAGGPT